MIKDMRYDNMQQYKLIQTMVDAVTNFGKVTVSTGYDNIETNIVLETGQGVKLPDPAVDGSYNLIWWNSTDHLDPADDPNKEIVRVIAKSEDTLIVMRGGEGTTNTIKNLPGRTYKMILSLTAKMIPDLQTDAQERVETHRTGDVHVLEQIPTMHGSTKHNDSVFKGGTMTDVTGSRAIDGTVYQNTGDGPMFVTVAVSGASDNMTVHVGSVTPPTVVATGFGPTASNRSSGSFFVPSGWYYKVTKGGAASLLSWVEWS